MKKAFLVLALLAGLIVSAPTAHAGDFSLSVGHIPTRVVAGYELRAGLSDPGEGIAIGLNNALSALSNDLKLPGLIVRWRQQTVLELGALSGGFAGAAGADSTNAGEASHLFLGAGGYLLEYIKADAVWIVDSRAESNYAVYAGADVARLGPKLVDLGAAVWKKTGL